MNGHVCSTLFFVKFIFIFHSFKSQLETLNIFRNVNSIQRNVNDIIVFDVCSDLPYMQCYNVEDLRLDCLKKKCVKWRQKRRLF